MRATLASAPRPPQSASTLVGAGRAVLAGHVASAYAAPIAYR
jgi:hypothetical protein